jgi:small subunit ribosomal protein S7
MFDGGSMKKFARRAPPSKPDPKYGVPLAGRFINCLMWGGKKNTARKLFYSAMSIIESRVKEVPPQEIFETAVLNVKPMIEVRSKRVGGANYQVPMPVKTGRAQSLAIRWIISAARSKKGRPMADRLAEELVAAFKREGEAMKKREDVHRMAEANKAFAHFAW